MIRVSTRGRYALRAMVDLAQHGHNGPVSRQDIAARQGISADYVAQLFRQLAKSELVEGIKGPGGGYRLARDPSLIRAGDVVQAVEGPIAVVECSPFRSSQRPACARADACATRPLWIRVSGAVAEVLNASTLSDLCRQAPLPAGPDQRAGAG